MSKPIYLTSGAYSAPSLIAGAQRCVNLYPEINPTDTQAPVPVTHYPRPGKTRRGSPTSGGGALGIGRGFYTDSNGRLYCVVADNVYFVDATFTYFFLGNLNSSFNIVSFADNGIAGGNEIMIVDGTLNGGYTINMTTLVFALLIDGTGLFTGADVVKYLQTYFIMNTVPNNQNFIITQPNTTTFDPLDIASKSSYPDNLATLAIRQRELWLMGIQTTEPWFLSGAVDFPFEAIPSTFVSYGVHAKYSSVFADDSLFWLSQNTQGQCIFVKSNNYQAQRISTHAIEAEIQKYPNTQDCVGSVYQANGHTFVVFTFREADRTWVYDLATKQWHQSAWHDDNGILHRDRAMLYTQAYGLTLGLDWETGEIYEINPNVYDDNGDDIQCIRGFPTQGSELDRVTHWSLTAYMETGTLPNPNDPPATLNLRVSDDGGRSFPAVYQTSLGKTGEYLTTPQFTRLGMARNRVYELFWAAHMATALNSVYVDMEKSES